MFNRICHQGVYESAFASGFTCLDEELSGCRDLFPGFVVGTHLNDGSPAALSQINSLETLVNDPL
jgi:hypothetical protein